MEGGEGVGKGEFGIRNSEEGRGMRCGLLGVVSNRIDRKQLKLMSILDRI